MNWSTHISEICTRARRQAGIIYRNFNVHTSSSTLLQLYLMFVRPHLIRSSGLEPPSQGLSDSLERVQKFALRMCMRDWSGDYATLLQSSNLPPLASRRRYLKLCFLYQVIQGQLTTCCLEKPASKFEKQQYLSTSEACYLFYCTSVLLFSPHYRLMELPPPLQCIVVTLCTFFKRSLLQLKCKYLFYLGYNYQLAICYYCILASCRTVIKKF